MLPNTMCVGMHREALKLLALVHGIPGATEEAKKGYMIDLGLKDDTMVSQKSQGGGMRGGCAAVFTMSKYVEFIYLTF
jgi:hypothetical protein